MTTRTVRPLEGLQATAASTRVLNLVAVARREAGGADYAAHPFFASPALNTSIVLKHKVRPDEAYIFNAAPGSATKVIVPFHSAELGLGGRAVLVGQRGWQQLIRAFCRDEQAYARDVELLSLLDQLPSLDPFLVREHTKAHGLGEIADCYFALSPADCQRMQAFVGDEIGKLIQLAYRNRRGSGDETARLVEILLSTRVDERLEPLRLTLNLEGAAYREGIFSWKGFLYYKWMLAELWPRLSAVGAELQAVRTSGLNDPELSIYLDGAIRRLLRALVERRREVLDALSDYDRAFDELTRNARAAPFRDFLIRAPGLFALLGERIGGIAHVASFWRYRFPRGVDHRLPPLELADILRDFEASLGVAASGWPAPRTPARSAA